MKAPVLLDDCFLHDGERLKHEDAIGLIRQNVRPVAASEMVRLEHAAGRVAAEDMVAPRDVPGFANSAVDGYAFAHASLSAGETRLNVMMRAVAGQPAAGTLAPGEAARIFTGAALPLGADTCIMQEDVRLEGNHIIVPRGVKSGANRRKSGEDLKAGEIVIARGALLRPQEIAAIASTGGDRVKCFERLKVALISTGSELARPGERLGSGGVYDSNHFMLRGLLAATGSRIEDFGIVADDRGAIDAAIRAAADRCDVILSTGGASRGEADHIAQAITDLGVLHAWQLAVKPGRPLAMGQIGDTVFLGLPGNPVAVFVTFLLYGLPVLALLQGKSWRPLQRYPVRSGFSFTGKKSGRREFWRGWIEATAEGPQVKKFESDGSGLISGLRRATGLIEVAEDVTGVAEGDLVAFIPFTEFGILPP